MGRGRRCLLVRPPEDGGCLDDDVGGGSELGMELVKLVSNAVFMGVTSSRGLVFVWWLGCGVSVVVVVVVLVVVAGGDMRAR